MNKQYGLYLGQERLGTLHVEYNVGSDKLSCKAHAVTSSWLSEVKTVTMTYCNRSYACVVNAALSAFASWWKLSAESIERREELSGEERHDSDLREFNTNWQQSRTGRRLWAYDTRPQDIHLAEIAYGLRDGRFANQTLGLYTYSVAQHSVHASYLGDQTPNARMAKLLHDAHEAAFKDMPKPLRNHPGMADYNAGCDARQRVINDWAHLDPDAHHMYDVKEADQIMLATERRDLMAKNENSWPNNPYAPAEGKIVIWDQPFSVFAFLVTFLDLAHEVCPDRVQEAENVLYEHSGEMVNKGLLYNRNDLYEGVRL